MASLASALRSRMVPSMRCNSVSISRVEVSKKEQKKLAKGFPDLTFDASNAGVLPEQAEDTLMGFVVSNKSLDVMKFAILKLYNPLAGRDVFGRGTGMR